MRIGISSSWEEDQRGTYTADEGLRFFQRVIEILVDHHLDRVQLEMDLVEFFAPPAGRVAVEMSQRAVDRCSLSPRGAEPTTASQSAKTPRSSSEGEKPGSPLGSRVTGRGSSVPSPQPGPHRHDGEVRPASDPRTDPRIGRERAKVSTGALVGRLWKANFHHYLVFSGRPDNPNRGCLSPGGAVVGRAMGAAPSGPRELSDHTGNRCSHG